MTLKEYFGDWLRVIDTRELYKVVDVVNRLYKTRVCEPAYNNIFKAFHVTPYSELCIVSLGQDPYPQKGVATGISFGNKNDISELSPSLQVIKKAVIDFEVPHNFITFDPSLEEWSRQGILLLNSALTVEVGKPLSHSIVWSDFMKSFLQNLSAVNPGLIYILWGSTAKMFRKYIKNPGKIYNMSHPAYYARTDTQIPHSFFRELSSVVKYNFNKDIKWYKEEAYE